MRTTPWMNLKLPSFCLAWWRRFSQPYNFIEYYILMDGFVYFMFMVHSKEIYVYIIYLFGISYMAVLAWQIYLKEFDYRIYNFFLIVQTGHNIEKLREKIRELMKQIIHSYSAAKTLPYILEGLRSRNNRTRIECADLVGFLLDNNGSEVYDPPNLIFFRTTAYDQCIQRCKDRDRNPASNTDRFFCRHWGSLNPQT